MLVPTLKVVSSNCNLSCCYCYYRNRCRSKSTIMNFKTLESVIKSFLLYTQEDKIHFVWHGGEPLLAGIKFYQRVIEFEAEFNRHGKTVENGIQTNGTLINEQWAEFFAENRFNVGVSIDGPEDIQNTNRPFKGGKGSFKKAMNGLKLLHKNGLYPSVINVITKSSLGRAKDIFNFFVENRINNFHPKPCYEIGKNGKLADFSITPDEYADFLIEVFDIWMNTNNPAIRIRNLYNIIIGLLGGHPKLCEFDGRCQLFITIELDGTVGACDSFPLKQYCMGNINRDSLSQIINSEGYKRFVSDIQKSKSACGTCEWWRVCHGGCIRYSYSLEKREWQHNVFCESKKRLFSYLDKRIKEIRNMQDS